MSERYGSSGASMKSTSVVRSTPKPGFDAGEAHQYPNCSRSEHSSAREPERNDAGNRLEVPISTENFSVGAERH